ncbi:hypothetical protein [Prevotella sp.]
MAACFNGSKVLSRTSPVCTCYFDGAIENLKVNGIPLGLWDKYAKRYPYEIKITFEDKRAIITAESPRSMEFGVRTIWCTEYRSK